MKQSTWPACVLLVMVITLHLGAQEGGLEKFADRREGIMTLQAVHNTLFDIVSVEALRPATSLAPTPPQQIQIHAVLPAPEQAGDLVARVRDPRMDYWMLPFPHSLQRNNPIFAWSREEYLAREGLSVLQLRPLVSKVDETVYYPAWLVTGRGEDEDAPDSTAPPEARYRFRFDSRAAVFANATVYRRNPEPEGEGRDDLWEKVVELPNIEEEFGGIFTVHWDGQRKDGPAPTGLYSLALQGELESVEITPLNLSLVFYHHEE